MKLLTLKFPILSAVFILAMGLAPNVCAQVFEPEKLLIFADDFMRSQTLKKSKNNKLDVFYYVQKLPVIYESSNLEKAKALHVNHLWSGGIAELSLDGSGQTVGYWDRNQPRLTHQEFGTRVSFEDAEPGTNDGHATQMAGTILANGTDSLAKGIANAAEMDAYNWKNDIAEMAQAAANNLLISVHPYAGKAGWISNYSQCGNDPVWTWYSLESENSTKAFQLGYYDTQAQYWDSVAYLAPNYLIIKAAGNIRGKGPSSQPIKHWKIDSSLNCYLDSTSVRDLNGGINGFESLSGASVAKNILVVGAVESSTQNFEDVNSITLKDYSGFGPTDDGRIKPDIVAPTDFYTTGSASDVSYSTSEGTSAASAFVAGTIALIRQHYQNLYTDTLSSASIRALLAHTAKDIENEGPDYKSGWGLIQPEKAVRFLSSNEHNPSKTILKDTVITDGNSIAFNYTNNDSVALKLTVAWTDPAGSVPNSGDDPTDIILVNDLDIRLISPTAITHYPWKLSPSNPSNLATKADNSVDNIEQIYIEAPEVGTYTVQISHKNTLENGSQKLSILLSTDEPKVEIQTIADGNWSNIGVWSGGKIPSSSFDKAKIEHAITLQNNQSVYDLSFIGESASLTLNSKKLEVLDKLSAQSNNGFIGDSLAWIELEGENPSTISFKTDGQKLGSLVVNVESDSVYLLSALKIYEQLSTTSGFLKTQENDLKLFADSVKSATYLKGTGKVIGDLSYQRKFHTSNSGWRMISAPVLSQNYDVLSDSFFTQGGSWAAHSADSTQASLWMLDSESQNFASIMGANDSFVSGKGYLFYMFAQDENGSDILPTSLIMKGTEPDSIKLVLHRGVSDSLSYNFVGNPFLGAIDWHEVVSDANNIGNSYAIWNPDTSQSNAGYVYYNSVSKLGEAGRYIAPMQAFFVQAMDENPEIWFKQSHKKAGEVQLYGKELISNTPKIQFKLMSQNGKILDNQAWVVFSKNGDVEQDEFDVQRIPSLNGKERGISFINHQQKRLVHQGRPISTATDTINIMVDTEESGFYNIGWNLKSIPEYWQILLYDSSSNQMIDLNKNQNFSMFVEDESAQNHSLKLVVNRSQAASNEEVRDIPTQFKLQQNYPNPFNPQTRIEYSIPIQSSVQIEIFDVLGRRVDLLENGIKKPGNYSVYFDASNLASGTYFYRITAGDFIKTLKMAVVK